MQKADVDVDQLTEEENARRLEYAIIPLPPQTQLRVKRKRPTDIPYTAGLDDMFYSFGYIKDEILFPSVESEAIQSVKNYRCKRTDEYWGQGNSRCEHPHFSDPDSVVKEAVAKVNNYLRKLGYSPIPDPAVFIPTRRSECANIEEIVSAILSRTENEINYCRKRGYIAPTNEETPPPENNQYATSIPPPTPPPPEIYPNTVDVLHPDQVGFVVDETKRFWHQTLDHKPKPYQWPPPALGNDLKNVVYQILNDKDPIGVLIEATKNEWRQLGYPLIAFPDDNNNS